MSASFNPRKTRAEYDLDWPPSPGMIGAGHSVSSDKPDRDPVSELHEVVEEVTRKPVMKKLNILGFY